MRSVPRRPPPETGDGGPPTDARSCLDGGARGPDGGCRRRPEGTPASACPSDRYAGSSFFPGKGVCLPEKPRGVEADNCPSGRYAGAEVFSGPGICRPERPRLEDWACPDGWESAPAFVDADGNRAVPEGLEGVEVCKPPERPSSCPTGGIAPAGASECRQHGSDCPSPDETWIAASAIRNRVSRFAGDLHYGTARDGSGGEGTRSTPYHTPSTAVGEAPDGDIIVLGRGTHTGAVDTEKHIALVGSCPPQTRLELPEDPQTDRIVDLEFSKSATVTNLTLTGPGIGVYVRDAQTDVHLRDLVIDEARNAGVEVFGSPGVVHLDRVAVRSTQPTPDGYGGYGLHASYAFRSTRRPDLATVQVQVGER